MLQKIFHQFKANFAFVILAIYSILAFVFAYERILNVDNSNFFFHIVDEQTFFTPENRIGIFISQIPLILLAKFGISLKVLLYTYSLTFPIFYSILAGICQWILKVKEASLTIALMLITGVAYSFFHPVTETYHALVYAILLYAILVSPIFTHKNTFLYYFLILTTCSLSILSHPIAIFATGFVAVFCVVNKQIKIQPLMVIFVIAAASLLLRMLSVSEQSYDGQQYHNMFENVKLLLTAKENYPILYLKNRFDSVYLSTIFTIILFITIAILNKKYVLLGYSLIAAFLFSFMAIVTFLKGDGDMMMEKSFMPAIFMVILPLSYLYFHGKTTFNQSITVILIVIAFLPFRQIILQAHKFSSRLDTIEQILIDQNYPKIMANFSDFNNQNLLLNNWNTGIDSYILAKCKLNKQATLFMCNNLEEFKIPPQDSSLFLGPTWWYEWHTSDFKSNYFLLPNVSYKNWERKMK